MTSQDRVPATRSHPLTTDRMPLAQPHPNSLVHNFEPDHSPKHGHEVDHGRAVRPLQRNSPVTQQATLGQSSNIMRGGRDRRTDEGALTKQILATHDTYTDELDVKPVLSHVEDILRIAKPLTAETTHIAPTHAHLNTLDEQKVPHHDERPIYSPEQDFQIKELAFPINKISCEILCKCSAGEEAHAVTMDLLGPLSNYSWDAKAAITLAAFAINYGEFWLVEHLNTSNALAKNIAILKDLPETMEHAGELTKKFEAVLDLLNAMLKVTHSVIKFKELPTAYINHDTPEMVAATAHIPTAVYWIIKSILAGASVLLNLIGSGHEYITSTAESWEILNLAHKLSVILEHLQSQLAVCWDLVDRKKREETYTELKKIMNEPTDRVQVLKAMLRTPDVPKPLYHGTTKSHEGIEELKMKYVLLLISGLDIPPEELNVLRSIYDQPSRRHEYEVLWLLNVDPIVTANWTQDPEFNDRENMPCTVDSQYDTFKDLRKKMPWYTMDPPLLVDPVAISYINEVWDAQKKPRLLVVLDPQGKRSNLDAFPMMWIWGSNAIPFTKTREQALWEDIVWNIELLADSIDPRIPEWIGQSKVICLYGGEDIDWIRKFTLATRAAAHALKVPLEMLYVGKRNSKDKVRQCHEIIDREKLSHVFSVRDYYDYVWYFWVRLCSMWNSNKHIGMTIENGSIMQEIMDVLTFDSSEQGWAVFSRGNDEMTKGKGDIVLPVLENYSKWASKMASPEDFVRVLDEEIKGSHPEHHCNRLILPRHAEYIPERVPCAECGKVMDKYVMYRCCTD